ncbi:MAG TPA: flavodoxin domain-containing protein [Virgibacillus sp.]|nr:flavodoxin domain-containing protein [Virgibacillus sp.]
MGKVLVLYTSLTGNTEVMAEAVLNQLDQYDGQVVSKSFAEDALETEELLDYEAILIGIYTWVDGDLPFEVEDFYDELEDLDLTGKVCGTFGSADREYEQYGTATEMLYDMLEEQGATMISDKVIVDLEPDDSEIERCRQLADTAMDMISG